MSKKIGILTIHGMGNQLPNYDDILKANLYKEFSNELIADITFKSIWYHGDFQGNQQGVWDKMAASKYPLDQQKLRKFFLYFFSDAATSEFRPDSEQSTYKRIQKTILLAIEALITESGNEKLPLIIIAHSLGCQIISNYIWDAQNGIGIWKDKKPKDYQKLATVDLMITSGCNIPLFVSGLEKIEAINKPNEKFKWYNYYDRDDILGWPLKPLSKGFDNAYANIVSNDIEVDTGWTPFSHSDYWEDDDFIKPIAELIGKVHASL